MAISGPVANLIKNPFLLSVLAQQGYSTTPGPSPLGVIGRAGLQANQIQQQQGMADLQKKLIEARIGSLQGRQENPFGSIDPSKFTQESIARFEKTKDYGDLVLRENSGMDPAAVQEYKYYQSLTPDQQAEYLKVRRAQPYASVPGVGYGAPDPRTGQFQTSVPESQIVAGTNTRAIAQGEGSRGNVLQPNGQLTPVPGSKAEAEKQAKEQQNYIRNYQQSTQAQTVVEDVQRLNKLIEAGDVPFGRAAALQENFNPFFQSEGYRNADALVKSVQGNVGVDQLINIKKQGSGLGQVPQQQLNLLSRLLGELNLNQSKEQFIRTWNRTGEVYQQIWNNASKELGDLGRPSPDVFPKLGVPSKGEPQRFEGFSIVPDQG